MIVQPTPENLARAGAALRHGKLVVMPTETVYGVAADAWNAEAVMRIFEIKERPRENPIIVHVAHPEEAQNVAAEFNEAARRLTERFWPGPLTVVVPKREELPKEVTAGASTVAIRMPAHQVALDLIRACGCPIAAPSANRFMQLSPTSAEAVDARIAEHVEFILDGGPCVVGLESTVVDLTDETPRILRPGGVSRADIEACLGTSLGVLPPGALRRSPGMYQRHYAPRSRVEIVDVAPPGSAALVFEEPSSERQIKMPLDAAAYGAALYRALRTLDMLEDEVIYVEAPPDWPDWEAVYDRLRKASAHDHGSLAS